MEYYPLGTFDNAHYVRHKLMVKVINSIKKPNSIGCHRVRIKNYRINF